MDNKPLNEEKNSKEITISGRLGADAKLGESKIEKKPVLNFSVADNTDKDHPKWHNVQVWEKDIPKDPLKKGDLVELKGFFKNYETASGTKQEFVATKITPQTQELKPIETLKGNLGQDPKFEVVNGNNNASFSIALGNDSDNPTWQNVQVWNKNIEKNNIASLKKGDFVEVKGSFGKEYPTEKYGIKKDLILTDCKLLKESIKKNETQSQSKSETPAVKQEENKVEKQDEKKSRGMKM